MGAWCEIARVCECVCIETHAQGTDGLVDVVPLKILSWVAATARCYQPHVRACRCLSGVRVGVPSGGPGAGASEEFSMSASKPRLMLAGLDALSP